ncbi:MAG: hypothetical protein RLZZ106_728 [Cyanobacteriota bacterium]|jgi:hypothetical protein
MAAVPLAGGESRIPPQAEVQSPPGLDRVRPMEDTIGDTLAEGLNEALTGQLGDVLADPSAGSNVMAFLLVAGLGLGMALIYVPLRVFLTVTARSRRLRLLQRIRRLREELTQPVGP